MGSDIQTPATAAASLSVTVAEPSASASQSSAHDQHQQHRHSHSQQQQQQQQQNEKVHKEEHFMASEMVRDIIIGMSDGLTVPFALAAGLSGSGSASSRLVVTAGLAEVAAGSIAMGLGGYLAAKSDMDHYKREEMRERREIVECPDKEAEEVAEILARFGLEPGEYKPVVEALTRRADDWVEFMMRFELGLERPAAGRALRSAATIALSYVVGGLVPLAPYMALPRLRPALAASAALTAAALLAFGLAKGRLSGVNAAKSALHTLLVGALASAAAFGLARTINLASPSASSSSSSSP